MSHGGWPSVLGVLLVVLAGCAGQAGPKSTSDASGKVPKGPTPEVSEETGAIQGVILSPEELPLAAAQVTLFPSERSASSDADGRYVFDSLAPGVYTVRVNKLGYLNAEEVVRVDAGAVATRDFTLQDVPRVLEPRSSVFGPYTGRMHCQMSITFIGPTSNGKCGTVPVVGETPVTDLFDDPSPPVDFPLESDDWTQIVVEARWENSSLASRPTLVQYMSYAERKCNHWFNATAPELSPIKLVVTKGVVGERANIPDEPAECADQPSEPQVGMDIRTWLQIPQALWSMPVDYAVEVRYDIMATVFYSMVPDPDYSGFTAA